MAHFYGSADRLVYSDGSYSTAPAVPAFGTITTAATIITFAYTGPATHYRIYEAGGAAGSWVSLGSSPVTVSSLTANTPYTIDLSADGSTVAATTDTGTTNPGSGGGEPEIPTATFNAAWARGSNIILQG